MFSHSFAARSMAGAAMAAAMLAMASPAMAHPAAQQPATAHIDAAHPLPAAMVERPRFTAAVVGHGPDIILIPGLATPRAVWDATVQQLQGRYRLHIIQVRGFGDAPGANAEGPLLQPLVADLTDYIKSTHLDHPAVIGHSMGGLVAATIAAQEPDLLDKVMIVDSLPFFGLIFSPAATVDALRPQAEAMLPAMLVAGQRPMDAGTLQRMSATSEGQAQIAAWGAQADYRVTARGLHDILLTDIRPDLPRITVPVTLLYPYMPDIGPEAAVDALYTNAYAGLRGVRLQRVAGSRHFISIDQPDMFASAVEGFLSEGGLQTIRLADDRTVMLLPGKGTSGGHATCTLTIREAGRADQMLVTIGEGDSEALTCGHLYAAGAVPAAGMTQRIALLYEAYGPHATVRQPVILHRDAPGNAWQLDDALAQSISEDGSLNSIAAIRRWLAAR